MSAFSIAFAFRDLPPFPWLRARIPGIPVLRVPTMRRALLFALACVLPAAHAQTGTYTAPQAPQITVQPVQTPVITNTPPAPIEQPAGRAFRPASEPRLLQLVPAEESA